MKNINFPLIIIGILLIIGVGIYFIVDPIRLFEIRQDMLRLERLQEIQVSLENYYDDHGKYPRSSSEYLIFDDRSNSPVQWGKNWPVYSTLLPLDPSDDKEFVYVSRDRNDYQTYGLYAAFSYPDEIGVRCSGGEICDQVPMGVMCGEFVCSGGVSSPNASP